MKTRTATAIAAAVLAVLVLGGCLEASDPAAGDGESGSGTAAPSTEVSSAVSGGVRSPPADRGYDGDEIETNGSGTAQFGVGEAVGLDGVTVTVDEVYYVEHVPSEVIEAIGSSRKHVVADVTVENGGRTNVTVTGGLSVGLANPQGYVYQPRLVSRSYEGGFGSAEVAAGGQRRGRIVFAVPRRSTAFTLRFTGERGSVAELTVPDRRLRYSIDRASAPRPEGTVEITSVGTNYVRRQDDENSGTIGAVTARIENTGEIAFRPRLDVEYQHGTTERRLDSIASFSTSLQPGRSAKESMRLDERIEESGEYRIQVYLLDAGTGDEIDSTVHIVDIG